MVFDNAGLVDKANADHTPLTLAALRNFANEFAAKNLNDSAQAARSSPHGFSRKEINDALWGTISLTPSEVALLDTPLLQRLRYVKQLGVVHWTYPGAVHTRFEHTIGALHQVQNLVSAINAIAVESNETALIGSKQLRTLRLSALLHDIGHGAFSHVCEQALSVTTDISIVATEFGRTLRVENRHLSEIVAYYVVKSPAMHAFLMAIWHSCADLVLFGAATKTNVDELQDLIAKAITGQLIDNKIPLLHELISGPFDADKLDYYARDARLAGTPSNLDISRLIQKVTVRSFAREDLPEKIAEKVQVGSPIYWLFGIKWSGLAVLDELHLTRVLLYSKIYRHAKVVAVEQMIRAFVAELACIAPTLVLIRFFYNLVDDTILHLRGEDIARHLGLDVDALTEQQQEHLTCAAEILSAIRNRRLVVKSFQLQGRYPGATEQDATNRDGLHEFGDELRHPDRGPPLISEILDDIGLLLDTLGADGPGARSAHILKREVLFHVQPVQAGGAQINRAYLMPTSGKPVPFLSTVINKHGWAESYLSDQPSGYVFAPHALANIVYLSVERILRTRFDVRLPHSAVELSKRDPVTLENLRRTLSQRGAYKSVPFDIRPVPEALSNVAVVNSIELCEKKFASYLEPQIAEPQQNPRDSERSWAERTTDWLRQFDNNDHVECAVKVLSAIQMITRNDTVESIRSFVRANPVFAGATVVPLGESKDSGAVHGYFAGDISGLDIQQVTTLDKLPGTKAKRVIFIDDFTATGGQATDILAAGFGQDGMRGSLGETRELFGSDIQEYLKHCKMAFVFVAAWDQGLNAITERSKQLKLDCQVYGHHSERDLPYAFEGKVLAEMNTEVVAGFKQRCEKIGETLAFQTSAATDRAEKAKGRALGYGNRALLLATPFNVPSQTLTAIWAGGTVDGIPWTPLLRRRKKT